MNLIEILVHIRECGTTLYVGLTGIVWKLKQKSTGIHLGMLN